MIHVLLVHARTLVYAARILLIMALSVSVKKISMDETVKQVCSNKDENIRDGFIKL